MSKLQHTRRLGALAMTTAAALSAGLGALTIGATGAGASTTATPATPASLSSIQAKAAAAIATRVTDLNRAVSKVNGSHGVGSDATTLDAYLQRDLAPLQALGAKIAADTTATEAQADYQSIFSDYRVLVLVLPAAALAGDADRITVTAIPALTADAQKAKSHVNATNQPTLQPLIDSLNADIRGATNATSGLASTVLGYVPSQWNANNALLSPFKSGDATANGDLKNARGELQDIREYFKSSHPAVTPTTSTTPTTSANSTTPTTAG